ncbi:hypothetical protein [Sphingomonas phyllosphaerae]|uniref:hypothetical protein n=1 Tax=Sphingomonas phyllosphaerae TaxID=257003 RepID=UPI000411E56E|nr:hypothetical protein [Sphingomonas phyllosphaerae]
MAILAVFNHVITRAVFLRELQLIDLRLIRGTPSGYVNWIEPLGVFFVNASAATLSQVRVR